MKCHATLSLMERSIDLQKTKTFPTFMCDRRNYANCMDYWSPDITGDWVTDTAVGKEYADEAVRCIRNKQNPSALGHLIKAMIGKGGYTGVEVGFFHRMSEHLLKEG